MANLKLFMVLLGNTPPGRRIEQHDIYFGIADSLDTLIPEVKAFWPEGKVHIDAWREVTSVENYQVSVQPKNETAAHSTNEKLFFLNLGGYEEGSFEEKHYILLTVKSSKGAAFKEAKATLFYQQNNLPKGPSHIDDKFGVDVDDLYEIEDILAPELKEKYQLMISPVAGLQPDKMNLGYVNLYKD